MAVPKFPYYPALITRPNQAFYSEQSDDPAIYSDQTEAGYQITRARYTSKPKTTYTFGYTNFRLDDKRLFDQFFFDMHGGSKAFYWIRPSDATMLLVRFVKSPTFKITHYVKNKVTGDFGTSASVVGFALTGVDFLDFDYNGTVIQYPVTALKDSIVFAVPNSDPVPIKFSNNNMEPRYEVSDIQVKEI